MSSNLIRKLCWLTAGAALVGVTVPALAQNFDAEDITVTSQGRYYVPDSVQSLSQRVRYDDLDLIRHYDRQVLKGGIADSADFLCDRLGESDDNLGANPSFQTADYKDCGQQARGG